MTVLHAAACCALLAGASAWTLGAPQAAHGRAAATLRARTPPSVCVSEPAELSVDRDVAGMCSVYLLNDGYNMREYVARVLMMVCSVSEREALSIMMGADWSGRALVGTWERPIAEHTYEGMTKAGLQAILLEEEDQEQD